MQPLRDVVAPARAGNFSRAAEQCHVAQPSLSQQIRKLEDELGERLFDRMKRETKLTAPGEVFLRRAMKMLEEVEAAKREVVDARNLMRGTLTIGVRPAIAPCLLPALVRRTPHPRGRRSPLHGKGPQGAKAKGAEAAEMLAGIQVRRA